MPKKPSPQKIKKHRVYTIWETAEALGLHRRTVERWICDGGLAADRTQKPWLIDGAVLKRFLEARRDTGRTRMAVDEMYCLPCRAARTPDGRMADFELRTQTTGCLVGLCPDCGRLMHRFVLRRNLEQIRASLDVTVQTALTGIEGGGDAPRIVTNKMAKSHHG